MFLGFCLKRLDEVVGCFDMGFSGARCETAFPTLSFRQESDERARNLYYFPTMLVASPLSRSSCVFRPYATQSLITLAASIST